MEEPLPILRGTEMQEAGRSASALRRRAASDGPGRLVRVGPNAFVRGLDWDAAGPRRRYVTRVHARLRRLSAAASASHVSAVALHGLPWLHGWPETVHATVPRSQYHGASRSLVLHTRALPEGDRTVVGPLRVTTLPRTVADVLLSSDVRTAVVVADAALRAGWSAGVLSRTLERDPSARGIVRARLVLGFADARSASAAESLGRVVLREVHAPEPVLQQEFVVDGHRHAVDFWFPEQGVVVEIDGRAKYTQSRHRGGRSPDQVFVDEKRRHERLLTVPAVRAIVRLEWRDLWDVDRLVRRLRAAGLPCSVRPVPSALGGVDR